MINRIMKRKVDQELKINRQVDLKNCYSIIKITDKNILLQQIILGVPDNSIWAIEGLYDRNIIGVLKNHFSDDESNAYKATIWPGQDSYTIKLTEAAKKDIIANLYNWNLDSDIIHQHIYLSDTFYFTLYDNLSESCTWVGKEFDIKLLMDMERQDIVEFTDTTND